MTSKTKPQDRKPTAKLVDGVYQVDVRGIKLTVDRDALDDFELLADLADLQAGDGAKTVSVFRRLVGDHASVVLDALRGENGRVKASDASVFIRELFGALAPKS